MLLNYEVKKYVSLVVLTMWMRTRV